MTASLAKVLPSVVVGTIAAVFSYDRGLNFSAPAAAAAPARGSPVATWLTGAPVGASFKDFVPPLASALGAQTDWCAPQFEVTLALDRSLVSVAFGTFLAVLVLEALRLLLFKSIFSGLFRYVGDARRGAAWRRSSPRPLRTSRLRRRRRGSTSASASSTTSSSRTRLPSPRSRRGARPRPAIIRYSLKPAVPFSGPGARSTVCCCAATTPRCRAKRSAWRCRVASRARGEAHRVPTPKVVEGWRPRSAWTRAGPEEQCSKGVWLKLPVVLPSYLPGRVPKVIIKTFGHGGSWVIAHGVFGPDDL